MPRPTGSAAADCEIDFEGCPDRAAITIQYLSCGVVFSPVSADPPPQIYDYGAPDSKILHSFDWYAQMIVEFVEPTSLNQYRPVALIEFDNVAGDGDLIHVDVFDVNDALIGFV